MPVSPTYPGVYIEEVASGVRTITGVPTSITAFVGIASRGPVDEPQFITSYADYERLFGSLAADNPMGYSVFHYYQNNGSQAIIVRVVGEGADPATINLDVGVTLQARSPGEWGNRLRARVEYEDPDSDANVYNLIIRDLNTGEEERYAKINIGADSPRRIDRALESSTLVRFSGTATNKRPPEHADPAEKDKNEDIFGLPQNTTSSPPAKLFDVGTGGDSGTDGSPPNLDSRFLGSQDDKKGMYQLLKTDIFNILVFPPLAVSEGDPTLVSDTVLSAALTLCVDRRAMLVADAPGDWDDVADAVAGISTFLRGERGKNAAVYFPYLRVTDPDRAQRGRRINMPPAGAVAGVYARTDVQRGVWKAPAGTDASLNGVNELELKMTDLENGRLNPLGVNCLRAFPIYGTLVWGARTLRGADELADEWKYVPVRRLALFIEESLYRGTKWVVFEPNDEPLWAQIRLNVGAFMQNLFRQGAFQGSSPRDAYFVKCDKDTTTQTHINLGIVNIHVGFAPLKPAEFVIIKLQQMAGQVEV